MVIIIMRDSCTAFPRHYLTVVNPLTDNPLIFFQYYVLKNKINPINIVIILLSIP